MMRVIKIIIALMLIIIIGYSFAWYYIANKITSEINNNYANKPIVVHGIDKAEYHISFKKAHASGFPFKMLMSISGWTEESRGAIINYMSPIHMGYSFGTQKIYVSYNGDIEALYKPINTKFGAKPKVKDYLITIDMPLNRKLIDTISNMKDSFEVVNHLGELNISTKKVEIFDLNSDEKFFDKEYELFKFSYKPTKYYVNLDDLLNNIPQFYKVEYVVKTNEVNDKSRRLPVSLFYGFSVLPSGFDIKGSATIKTGAKTAKDLAKEIDLDANLECTSPLFDVGPVKINYKGGIGEKSRGAQIFVDSKVQLKKGFFEDVFKKYMSVSPRVVAMPGGQIINREILYIIANKDAFRFNDLENSRYEVNVDLNSYRSKDKIKLKVNNLSIFSQDSGIRFVHDSEASTTREKNWHANGILYIKNYPAVIDFTSGYIYRFGKFKILSNEARELYVDVNKTFLKQISDYPTSTSNDLSFEYIVNSQKLNKTKVGTVQFDQLAKLYQLILYDKLLAKVGPGGDVLAKMKNIVPYLDENEPSLKKLLPKIKNIESIEKIIPKDAQKTLEKIIPVEDLKKKLGKDLLGKFLN
jgi:hypothetical protein